MSIADSLLNRKGGEFSIGQTDWSPPSVRCHVAIIRDAEDLYSAIVLNLPGAGGSGDTAEAAIEDAADAVREMIASYNDDGEKIPWLDITKYSIPEGAAQKWILVHV